MEDEVGNVCARLKPEVDFQKLSLFSVLHECWSFWCDTLAMRILQPAVTKRIGTAVRSKA